MSEQQQGSSGAKCPKCLHADISWSYHSGRWRCEPYSRYTNSSREDEHMHLTCRRCGYDWCLDVPVQVAS